MSAWVDAAVDRLRERYEDDLDLHVIDLDKVVELVRAELPDAQCYVEQTGGGCATIYLGQPYEIGGEELIPVSAGPGWFDGPNWTEGRGHRDEFYVGWDINDPATMDAGDYEGDWEIEGPIEPEVARVMVERYRAHPRFGSW